ncbi:uncharacterized protein LOC143289701 [Babylonia areolata]|uniref:uncharacterized protein LOC143289701 n=1 Tax=Babylonia areolata TaxID=304850 RepID=UPI003FD118CC
MASRTGLTYVLPSVHVDGLTTAQDMTSVPHVARNTSLGEACFKIRLNDTDDLPWDNPDNIVGPEVEAHANKFKLTILPFLFLIGGPANVINMAVFYKQGLKDRVNLCLFSLSLTDAVFLISSVFLNGHNIYLHFTSGVINAHSDRFMTNNNLIFFLGTGFISFVLSAIIACERCFCVLSPLKYQTALRTRTMAVIIVSVYIVVSGLYFIVAFRYRVGCIHDPVTGAVITTLVEGVFYRAHKELIDRMDSIIFGAGLSGCMMVVVITATMITTMKLRQLVTWRTETSSSSSSQLSPREVALTKMLIGNSVFFIVCTSPACLFRVVCLFLPEMSAGGRYHNFYLSTLWILEGFCYVNYTFNFFIYFVMGSRYRQTLSTLIGRDVNRK